MPPRYTYWTIILEGKPTAFRARTRDELAPTLRQLQARHPDAVMMWFAHGRLWESPEQQREAAARRRKPGSRRRAPSERSESKGPAPSERSESRDWQSTQRSRSSAAAPSVITAVFSAGSAAGAHRLE